MEKRIVQNLVHKLQCFRPTQFGSAKLSLGSTWKQNHFQVPGTWFGPNIKVGRIQESGALEFRSEVLGTKVSHEDATGGYIK